MKQFKPKMSGGALAPEAHKEWEDKDGKHVIDGAMKEAGSAKAGGKKIDKDGFGSPIKHEKVAMRGENKAGSGKSPFASSNKVASVGKPTGPQKGAGKGSSGAVKEKGGKGYLNRGNGLKKGAGK